MERIIWSIENCGPMPKAMVIGFILLFVLAVITVIMLKKKGGDGNE